MVIEWEPDVIHERYSLFSTILAVASARLGDVTAVLEVNAPLIDEQRTHRVLVDEGAATAALRAQLSAADVAACVSEQVAAWVRDHTHPVNTPDVRVTPNGVNTHRIQQVTPDLSGAPVVVFVGTLKPWHGVEHLLNAATMASQSWRLRIIGDGPQREKLQQMASEHSLDVEFVGSLPPEQVPRALEGALVAVAPYPDVEDHYFSPLKVYEYGAAGIATVASRIGQIPGIVDETTGILVPPSDPAALAKAIDELAADPVRARRLGAAARARMAERHSWDRVLEQTMAMPVAVGG